MRPKNPFPQVKQLITFPLSGKYAPIFRRWFVTFTVVPRTINIYILYHHNDVKH